MVMKSFQKFFSKRESRILRKLELMRTFLSLSLGLYLILVGSWWEMVIKWGMLDKGGEGNQWPHK